LQDFNYALIDKHNLHIYRALPADSSKFDGRTNNRRYCGSAFASDGTVAMYGLL
jgi:hypothetical protein